MSKKKKLIKIICKNCCKEPEFNKKESNENWTVVDNIPCKYCGGQLTFRLEEQG
jgi:hypothetical protein